MKNKILTLSLLSTLFVTHVQGSEGPLSVADKLKKLREQRMATQADTSPAKPAQHLPPVVVHQSSSSQPQPQHKDVHEKHSESPAAGLLPQAQTSVPVVVAVPTPVLASVNEMQGLIRQFKADAQTPAEVTGAFAQILSGQSGVDVFERVSSLRKQVEATESRVVEAERRTEEKLRLATSEVEQVRTALDEKQRAFTAQLAALEETATKKREEELARYSAEVKRTAEDTQRREEEMRREFEQRLASALRDQNHMHLAVWNQIVKGLFTLGAKDGAAAKPLPDNLTELRFALEDEEIRNLSGSKSVKLVFPPAFK